MAFQSPLRDLARKIRDATRTHIASSQVADFMNHIDNHLSALAYIEEVHRRDYEREKAAGGGRQCVPEDVPDGGRPA